NPRQYFRTDEFGERVPSKKTGDLRYERSDRELSKLVGPLPENLTATLRLGLQISAEGGVVVEVERVDAEPEYAPLADQMISAVQRVSWIPFEHVQHGFVDVEADLIVDIRPAFVQEELRLARRELVATVLHAFPGKEHSGSSATRDVQPTIALLESEPLDELGVYPQHFHGDYVLWLEVDSRGLVERSRVRSAPQGLRLRRDFEQESRELMGALDAWSDGVSVEPVVHPRLGPLRAQVSVALRLGPEGFDVISYEPPREGWQRAFRAHYRLEEGRSFKLLPGDPIPERLDFLQTFHPRIIQSGAKAALALGLQEAEGTIDMRRIRSQCHGGCDLFSAGISRPSAGAALLPIAHLLDLNIGVEGDVGHIGAGDFVMRADASGEELLNDFLLEAEHFTGIPLRWERAVEMKPAVVLRGSLGEIQREPKLGEQRVVHLFVHGLEGDAEVTSGFATGENAETVRMTLEGALRLPVIDETVGPPIDGGFGVRTDRSAVGTERIDELLANVEAQTELEIEVTEMPVERIVIRPRNDDPASP
ncbi:MAG: hypothetical protein AAF690_22975, partial [Acidobacteriota bacterium]